MSAWRAFRFPRATVGESAPLRPSASSSDLLGNGEMLVMRTIERPADPLGELVGPQKPVELHDPAFPVYPLGLDGVQPRTLLRQKATQDPQPTAAVLDLPALVFSEPSPELLGDVPRGVVPEMSSSTFLPAASSSSAHHETNRVVTPLTGLHSTNLSHISPPIWGR